MFLQNFLKDFTEELKWHIPRIGLRNVALKGCKTKQNKTKQKTLQTTIQAFQTKISST